MKFNTGKLYQIKHYFWYLYPSRDIAAAAVVSRALAAVRTEAAALRNDVADAAYWSKQLNCNVTYIPENGIFCLLEEDGNFLKILSPNGELGWIIYAKKETWTKNTIEEINQ